MVAAYLEALAAGDLSGILSSFSGAGCAREPAGSEFEYCGREAVAKFYAALFSNGGGIQLEHCTATDDGVATAVEYNVVRWGATPLPKQAGVAVYERGEDGLLDLGPYLRRRGPAARPLTGRVLRRQSRTTARPCAATAGALSSRG